MTHTFSLMSGDEVRSAGLIENAVEEHFRASTYDVAVGTIISSDEPHKETSIFVLKPGGMVRVVSKEFVRLPDGVTGHVLLKNKLCSEGVLALNVGVIDPGYNGPISSTLINFGRSPVDVKVGRPFLRISFHRCPLSPKTSDATRWSHESYLDYVKQQVFAYSGPTFLNMDQATDAAAKKAFGSFQKALFGWATLAALLLTAVTICAPVMASAVDKYIAGRDRWQAETEKAIEKRLNEQYSNRLRELEATVAVLKATPQPARTTAPAR